MTTIILGAGGMAAAFEGVEISHEECDVRDLGEITSVVSHHKPEVVILTAGISNPGPIEAGGWEEEIATNLGGAFNVARVCIEEEVETVIFIASVAGLHGKPNHASYSASKAGVISLVQSMAHEGHRSFAIAPGRVDTPMREKDYPQDTPGSRLDSQRIWETIQRCLDGTYASGDTILIRKVGLINVVEEVVPVPWRDTLAVGQPVTI